MRNIKKCNCFLTENEQSLNGLNMKMMNHYHRLGCILIPACQRVDALLYHPHLMTHTKCVFIPSVSVCGGMWWSDTLPGFVLQRWMSEKKIKTLKKMYKCSVWLGGIITVCTHIQFILKDGSVSYMYTERSLPLPQCHAGPRKWLS